jgi:hypothetical protein
MSRDLDTLKTRLAELSTARSTAVARVTAVIEARETARESSN